MTFFKIEIFNRHHIGDFRGVKFCLQQRHWKFVIHIGWLKNERNTSFYSYYKKCARYKKSQRTQEIYEATLHQIEYFSGKTLHFEDITVLWLKDFEQYLISRNNSTNSRRIHFANIKAVFNAAIKDNLIQSSLYPFKTFQFKGEKTIKRNISIDQLRTLRHYQSANRMVMLARDIFLLSFYLIGINTVDLVRLTRLEGGRIKYRRSKTGRLYNIEVLPEAYEIIQKYQGKEYLLYFNEHYKDYRIFSMTVNQHLKHIGQAIQVPQLSLYYARHTWATLASRIGISRDTIACALGHDEEKSCVTNIYIEYDTSVVDRANRQLINYLKEENKKE